MFLVSDHPPSDPLIYKWGGGVCVQSINDFKNFCHEICILVRFSENTSIRCYSDMVTDLIFMLVGLVSKVFPILKLINSVLVSFINIHGSIGENGRVRSVIVPVKEIRESIYVAQRLVISHVLQNSFPQHMIEMFHYLSLDILKS